MADASPQFATGPESGPRTVVRDQQKDAIVIVGHGMVGQRMAEEVRRHADLKKRALLVFGRENRGAYDRVHLARLLEDEDPEVLSLVSESWKQEAKPKIYSAESVDAIDRETRTLVTDKGRRVRYGHLILATGSDAVTGRLVPEVGGSVRVLRTVDDMLAIGKLDERCRERGEPVVIVGGGLLGLELAGELKKRGTEVRVVENASYPLSRQLSERAGQFLEKRLRELGVGLHFDCRVDGIRRTRLDAVGGLGGPATDEERAVVRLSNGEEWTTSLVVLAMGVRPRDHLAREAGIVCDLLGGIVVNDSMLTSDPHISAVGECCRHRGQSYGLVSPGYAQAEVVAERLVGKKAKFEAIQVGTRLKFPGLELSVIGESQARGLGTREVVWEDEQCLRRLVLHRGRIIGITAIGPWDELARAQEMMTRGAKISARSLRAFEANEVVWPKVRLSVKNWPDSAVVCTCMGVSCGALKSALDEGATSLSDLCEATGASTVCGTCRPLVATLTDEEVEAREERALMFMSVIAAWAVLAYWFIPAIPVPDSVLGSEELNLDMLWSNQTIKQVSGFTLAGLFALSGLFSARKRLASFNWLSFEAWRLSHAIVGVVCMVGAFAHTGFRLGEKLDFALMMTFLGATLLGAAAGGFDLIEKRLPPESAQKWRAWVVRSHIYLLWPLPVLLSVHIAKVYFF